MANLLEAKMPPKLGATVKATAALLWISGAAWLVLHFFFQTPTEFGPGPNTWEPLVVRVHGIVAIAAVFLLGWVTSRHVVQMWRQRSRRVSGITLAVSVALLAVSGYALYYTVNDSGRAAFAAIHEILGVLIAAAALVHWNARR